MEQKKYCCRNCGSPMIREVGDVIQCVSCGVKFKAAEENKKIVEEMRTLADEIKAERVAALRRQLYEKATAEYTDSEAILDICRDLRSYLPDDFMAKFYEVANGGTLREYADFLGKIDVMESYPFIEGVVKFTVKSLRGDLILPLNNLIERAYKYNDVQTYHRLQTMAEDEAEKVMDGIYDLTIPRDAFILYSSKDMDKVMELVRVLEEQEGLSCFVAMRNLQHGSGAKANYQRALEQAIDYCKTVVFVSSKNSRSSTCDACQIELPYIRQKDIQNAPREYRRDYASIPETYKKRRVQYVLETPDGTTAADRAVKEFFEGNEHCYTPEDVAYRIFAYKSERIEEPTSNAELFKQFEAMMAAREVDETAALRAQIEEMKRQQEEARKQLEESGRQLEDEKRKREAEATRKADELRKADEKAKREEKETTNQESAAKEINEKCTPRQIVLWGASLIFAPFEPLFLKKQSFFEKIY